MNAYEQAPPSHRTLVDTLLADTAANGGLAPVDLDTFWADQAVARATPFGTDIPQVPLGAICNWECLFDALGVEQDWWRFQHEDQAWAQDLKHRYNDLSETIVGRRLLDESLPDPTRQWPGIQGLNDIFEAENVWEGGPSGSWWLKQSAHGPHELSALLDRVETRLEALRDFMLPDNWDAEKARLVSLGGGIPRYRFQRGPCTFACSIFGAEDLLLLYYDDPALLNTSQRL